MTTTETTAQTAPPPSPADVAALLAERTGLSAKGLAALYRLETELAWGEL